MSRNDETAPDDRPSLPCRGRPAVDQLGLAVLADLVESGEWNEYNYMLAASKSYKGEALEAVAEAMTWLRARASSPEPPTNPPTRRSS